MALTVGELVAYLDVNTARFDSKMAAAQGRFSSAAAAFSRVGGGVSAVGAKMTKMVSAPIAAIAIGSTIMASKFQSSMGLIETQAGGTAKEVEYLSAAILNMKNVQHGPEELANAMYHLRSVGLQGAKAMDALTAAEHLASVGHADLEETTNALAGAYKSGIRGTETFDKTVATLNATIGAGNLRMEDLNSAMASGVMVTAKQFGVSLVEVGAALATMTSRGIPATRGATALKMAFSGMAAPTSSAADEMNRLGMKTMDLAKEMRSGGLPAAIKMLQEHLKGMTDVQQTASLTKMFGAKSSQAILTLIGNLKDYQKVQKQVIENAKVSKFEEAVATQAKEAEAKWAKFGATMKRVSVQLGNAFLPTFTKLGQELGKLANKFAALDTGTKSTIIKWALLAAAAGPVIWVIGKIISLIGILVAGIGTVVTMIQGLTFALGAAATGAATLGEGLALMLATNPVGWAIAAVAAIAALAYGFYRLSKAMQHNIATAEDYKTVMDNLEGPDAHRIQKEMDKAFGGHYVVEEGKLVWKPAVEIVKGDLGKAVEQGIRETAARERRVRAEEHVKTMLAAAKLRVDEASAEVRAATPQGMGGKGQKPALTDEQQAKLTAARSGLVEAQKEVDIYSGKLDVATGKTRTVVVLARIEDLQAKIRKAEEEVKSFSKIPVKERTAKIIGDEHDAKKKLTDLQRDLRRATAKNWNVIIKAKIDKEKAKLKDYRHDLSELDRSSTNPKIQADIKVLDEAIAKAKAKLKLLTSQRTEPTIGISDQATGPAQDIRDQLTYTFQNPITQVIRIQTDKTTTTTNTGGTKKPTHGPPTGPPRHGVQPHSGGIFSGPHRGYAAVLHGREAVLPLDHPNLIPGILARAGIGGMGSASGASGWGTPGLEDSHTIIIDAQGAIFADDAAKIISDLADQGYDAAYRRNARTRGLAIT